MLFHQPNGPNRSHSMKPTLTPTLTETIALRLTLDECRALAAACRQQDRQISYVVRNLIRTFLRTQQAP